MSVTNDVMEDVYHIIDGMVVHLLNKNNKIVDGKKISANVPTSPLDNVSFHFEESVLKWKFVYQRRIALEMELSKEESMFQ